METSVLLPPARVDVYALHDNTIDGANSLIRDWRFSRVSLRVENSGIDGAISDYEQHESPDLIIVEVDDIGENFLNKLEQLAENCVEDTEAIIIGPQNDIHLYRKLIAMGVKDYLVSPAKEKELGNVIAQTLLAKKGLSDSQLISVIGAKGGVGTTSIAQNIAYIAADIFKQKTLIADAAGGWSSMTIPFGAEITTSFQEIVRQVQNGTEDDVKRLLHEYTDKLTLIPSGGDIMLEHSCDENSFEDMIEYFMKTYPVVTVDLSASERDLQKIATKKSHNIVIITTPLLSSLRNARSLIKEICDGKKDSEHKPHLLVNMSGICPSHEVGTKEIAEVLEYEVATTIPYNSKLFMGCEAGEKLPIKSKIAQKELNALVKLTEKLLPPSSKVEKNPKKDKKASFFSKLFGK